uniref:Uncharacterized protein n=1 Tax=Ananas comosus var. bracteatus TaxID=296719 RepID=A0A6V7PL55_ANACO|nr:unnamed protein product [Ananas comosus var. bracteatus]
MSDGSQSTLVDIESGEEGTSKKNREWLTEQLKVDDNLKEKGLASLDKIYGDASGGRTIFKCERKADGRGPPEPTAVAIGPYHRNCKNRLKFDDDYKLKITRFMVRYFGLVAEKYLEEMEWNEKDVRNCYDKDLCEWSREELPRKLLLDSSFILFVMDAFSKTELLTFEFFPEYVALHLHIREHTEQIKLDLLTVDNQIPFFTIETLLDCFPQDSSIRKESIEELALCCFDDLWPKKNKEKVMSIRVPWFRHLLCLLKEERSDEVETSRGAPYQFHHLLHLFHWSRIPKEGYQMDFEDRDSRSALQLYIPSATELQKSATKFKKKHSGSSLHVTFNRGLTFVSGVINIPVLQLYNYSKPIFRNLVAFEATPANSVLCFTAYTACMSCMLQREDDVKLLRERGIVASTNYKDAEIVKFFEELNKEVEGVEMPDTLRKLYTDVTDHHNSRISKWCGTSCCSTA